MAKIRPAKSDNPPLGCNRRLVHYFMICIVLLFAGTSSAKEQVGGYQNGQLPTWQLGFAYWNDNSSFEKWTRKIVPGLLDRSRDDHVTAGLWLKIESEALLHAWEVETFYHIITEKRSHFRVDLLAIGLLHRQENQRFGWTAGSYFLTLGNLGGDAVQSAVHRWLGYYQIRLPYLTKTLFGVGVRLDAWSVLWLTEHQEIQMIGSVRWFSSILPGKQQLTISGSRQILHLRAAWRIGVELYAGLTHYDPKLEWSRSIFRDSPQLGMGISARFKNLFQVQSWIIGGQYGQPKEPHFGICLIWGRLKSSPFSLSDIQFP